MIDVSDNAEVSDPRRRHAAHLSRRRRGDAPTLGRRLRFGRRRARRRVSSRAVRATRRGNVREGRRGRRGRRARARRSHGVEARRSRRGIARGRGRDAVSRTRSNVIYSDTRDVLCSFQKHIKHSAIHPEENSIHSFDDVDAQRDARRRARMAAPGIERNENWFDERWPCRCARNPTPSSRARCEG